MTEDLVFIILKEERESFLDGIESHKNVKLHPKNNLPWDHYFSFKQALKEAALFFYSQHSEEDISLWLPIFLKHADAISDGINKLQTGVPVKQSTDYHKILYNRIVEYAISNKFGKLVTVEYERQEVIDEECAFFEEETKSIDLKPTKRRRLKIIDSDQPRYAHINVDTFNTPDFNIT